MHCQRPRGASRKCAGWFPSLSLPSSSKPAHPRPRPRQQPWKSTSHSPTHHQAVVHACERLPRSGPMFAPDRPGRPGLCGFWGFRLSARVSARNEGVCGGGRSCAKVGEGAVRGCEAWHACPCHGSQSWLLRGRRHPQAPASGSVRRHVGPLWIPDSLVLAVLG